MSDYIKKEDAMKAICKRCLIENDICQHHWNCPYLGEISQVTAIEVVPKDFHDKTCEAMAKRHTEEIQRLMPKREEWADIIGYEGLYQISNEARVRNQKGEIMKQYIKRGRSTCYKAVKLYKNGRYETRYIHRIMAECFIPNPNNLPMINHIDEDGTNNRLDNLEWCTVKYNSNYGNARRNMSKGKKKKSNCGCDMRKGASK